MTSLITMKSFHGFGAKVDLDLVTTLHELHENSVKLFIEEYLFQYFNSRNTLHLMGKEFDLVDTTGWQDGTLIS